MATNKELEKRLNDLEEQNRLLRKLVPGLEVQSGEVDIEERADFFPHGSEKHAAFLGLIEIVGEDELEDAKLMDYVFYESPSTGRIWRLEDELGVQQAYPTIDPTKSVRLVLRQKISSFEGGKPPIPDTAPMLLVPSNVGL